MDNNNKEENEFLEHRTKEEKKKIKIIVIQKNDIKEKEQNKKEGANNLKNNKEENKKEEENITKNNKETKKEEENNFKNNIEKKEEVEGEFLGISLGSYKTVYSVFSNFNKYYKKKILEDDGKNIILSKISYISSHRIYGFQSEPYLIKNQKSSYNNLGRLIGFNNSNFYEKEKKFMLYTNDSINNFKFKIQQGKDKYINIDYKSIICDYLSMLNEKLFNNINEFENVTFCVPDYYTLYQRKELDLICKALDIKNVEIINESSAITMYYGYYKYNDIFFNHNFKENEKVLFIDFGYSKVSYIISIFKQNEFRVEKVYCNPYLGGRNLDEKILLNIKKEFKNSNNINNFELKPKIKYNSLKIISTAREKLSLNNESLIQIEPFYEGKNINKIFSTYELDEIIEKEIETFKTDLSNIIKQYKGNIKYIEMVGNVMRTKIFESIINEELKINLDKTILVDECISVGGSICGFYFRNNNCGLLKHFYEYNYYNILYIINDDKEHPEYAFKKTIITEKEKRILLDNKSKKIKIKFYYEKSDVDNLESQLLEDIITYEIHFNKEKKKDIENHSEKKSINIKDKKEFIINIGLNKPRIEINGKVEEIEIKALSGFLKNNNEENIIKELKKRLEDNKTFEKDYYDYSETRHNLSEKIYELIKHINNKKKEYEEEINNLNSDLNNLNNDLKYLREHFFAINEREKKIKEIENRLKEYKEKRKK